MAKEYMIGTLDDKPLLHVTLNGKSYYVDVDSNQVYADEAGLPEITDADAKAAILETIKDV